jgi:UDP-N-acetylmuramate--alanine ligase
LFDRFVICFNQADTLIVAPIYPAGEEPIEGVDAEWLFKGIRGHGHREVILCRKREKVLSLLTDIVEPGDMVITLGAGDIHRVGNELLDKL